MAKVPTNKATSIIGRNVTAELMGDILILRCDLSEQGSESKSGKSSVVGTTNGNVPIAGTDVRVGLNIYRPL